MANPTLSKDLTRYVLAVVCLAALVFSSIWIMQPFLAMLAWASLLVIATWPVMLRVQGWLGGRRWLAVAAMLLVLLLVFLLPVGLAVGVLVARAPAIAEWVKTLPERTLPAPPAWVGDVPLFGQRLATAWQELASEGPEGLRARIAPRADEIAAWFAAQVGGAGLLVVYTLITLVLAAVLFARGDAFAAGVRAFASRLAGERGDRAVVLAARATRAVALGVVLTAAIQAAIGGLGLTLAGIPVPGLLTTVGRIASRGRYSFG
jgi:predicted PurR-regulated permease PerM